MNLPHEQLTEAFGFTDEDLQANRDGRLTPRQQQQVKANMMSFWKVAGLTIVVVLIGTVLGAFSMAWSGDFFADISYVPIAFLIIAALAAAFLVWLYRHRQQVYTEIRAGHVTSVTGWLKIIESDGGRVGRFQIKKHNFTDLSQAQFDAVKHISQTHNPPIITVYYVPGHHKVVSVDLPEKKEDAE